MRVVHFGYADDIPGAARASYRLHREMLRAGADSTMVVARRDTQDPTVRGPRSQLADRWARSAPLVDYVPLRALQPGRREVSLSWIGTGRVREVQRLRPEVVQLHWICGGLVRPVALRRLARFPIVWRLPDMWPFTGVEHYAGASTRWERGYARGDGGYRSRLPVDVDRWAWRRKRRTYDRLPRLTIVAPSTWLADAAGRSPLFSNRRIEVITTGIDLALFHPAERRPARRRLGLPEEGRLVLFGAHGGGLNPRKGYAELQEAVARLQATWTGPPPTVVTFGEGTPGPFRFGEWPGHRLGHIDREALLPDVYSAADVFVAPSVEENLANTVLESLACGTPVVAFAIGGMADVIDHGRSGYLASAGSTDELASGMARVIGASDEWSASASGHARSTAEERFDQQRQAARYLALYDELLGHDR